MSHGRSEIKKSARRGKEMGTAGQGSELGRRLIGGLDREVETEVEACGGLYVGPWAASFRKRVYSFWNVPRRIKKLE
jgi:hypothetical protein